jgi:membrane protein
MPYVRPVRIVAQSFVDFFRDGGIMLAGSLSYFFMMTIVPFCLFLIAIIGHILGVRDDILKFLLGKLVGFFPQVTSEITDELKRIISFKKVLGSFSLVLYGFLSLQLFMSLQNAVSVIFKIKTRRPFLLSLLMALLIVSFIMILLLVSFGASSLIAMLRILRNAFPDIQVSAIVRFLITYFVPFVLVLIAASGLYKLLPHRRINIRHALAGALFTTLFLEIAKHLFTFYVSDVVRFGTLYGPLSAFIMFLLWIFYSWCIFLIGAEVVHNCEVMEAPRKREALSFRKRLKAIGRKKP